MRADAQLEWAIGNFLRYAQDQLPHLRRGSEAAALYVGRRLDQAWRALEWWGMEWLEQNEAHLVLSRVRAPVGAPPTAVMESSFDAIESPEAAHRSLVLAGDAVAQATLAPVSIASSLSVARLHFSAYRLSKYGWLTMVARNDHQLRGPAYQWWES
jgi:hypothetical protein